MERGQTIGNRYRLREHLGRGGMSVVWRAEDELLGREVAIKVMSAEVAADPASLRQLHVEARAAAALRHENVVEVYDYGETLVNGVTMPYVVMELVDGRPVSALLTAGPLPWRLAVLIGAQVAAALAAAHDRGVVHRDVKPANVMVAAGGVKLVDFGISAAVGERDTASGQILGTPAYLAPERLVNGTVRPATDVYALGLLLYIMLAGRMPWNASTTTGMLKAHRYRDPAPLPAPPDLPAEVAELVRNCLAKPPADRPAAVVATRVLRKAAGLPPLTLLSGLDGDTGAADEPTARDTSALPPSRRPVRRLVAAGGALLVLTGVAGALWPPGGSPAEAAATCHVTYAVQGMTSGRTVTAVTVTNTAPYAIGAWTLAFQLPAGQRLVHGSDAGWRQTGEVIEAAGGGLGAGATARASFDATYSTVAALPQSFTLNDVPCGAELSLSSPPGTVARAVTATSTSAATSASARTAAKVPVKVPVKAPAKGAAKRSKGKAHVAPPAGPPAAPPGRGAALK